MRGKSPTSKVRSASASRFVLAFCSAIRLARALSRQKARPIGVRRHPAETVGEEAVSLRQPLGEAPRARQDEEVGARVRQLPQRPRHAEDALTGQQRLLEQLAVGEIAIAVAQRLLLEALEVLQALLRAPLHAVVLLQRRLLPATRILHVIELG